MPLSINAIRASSPDVQNAALSGDGVMGLGEGGRRKLESLILR